VAKPNFWAKHTIYRAGCWAWADRPGATLRLQVADGDWPDFAFAEHPEIASGDTMCSDKAPSVPRFSGPRKIQVAGGMIACLTT